MKKMKYCAVLVTFNRSKLLEECLIGLLGQTVKLDKIIVIDNASTDNTRDTLKKYESLSEVEYVRLDKNTGGAGGFATGVEIAFKQGLEWIWLMDDDVEPEPNCLEILLRYSNESKCIHPTKIYTENNQIFPWNHTLDPQTGKTIRKSHQKYNCPGSKKALNVGCFEGMLIHSSIVDKIGFPDVRFFISGDDLIYGYLASQFTPVLYVRDAEFKKKIFKESYSYFLGIKRPFQSPFGVYFNIRNQFLKKEYLLNSDNTLNLNLFILLRSIKNLIEVLFFYRTMDHLKMFFWGLKDGLTKDYNGHEKFIK